MENGEIKDGFTSLSEMERLREQEMVAMEIIREGQELLDLNQRAVALLQGEVRGMCNEPKTAKVTSEPRNLTVSKNMVQISKLKKFSKGDNFSIFVDRFKSHVSYVNLHHDNLYLYLLQHVEDDITYSVLKSVVLDSEGKRNAETFCQRYMDEIYGDELIAWKHKLLNCVQLENEDIDAYINRIRELSNIAYKDKERADENCLLSFLKGVKCREMRVKLNESVLDNFSDAAKLAKRIERVGLTLRSDLKMETQGLDQSEVSDLNSIHNLKYTDGLNVKRSGITQNTENETCHVPSTQKWSKYGEKTWDLPSSRKISNKNSNEFWDAPKNQKYSRNFEINGGARKSKPIFRCFVCKKVGHKMVNCWYKNSERYGMKHHFKGGQKGFKSSGFNNFEPRLDTHRPKYKAGNRPGHARRTFLNDEQIQVLAQVKYQKDIIVRGNCNGTDINVLLDTGASVSLVSSRLVCRLDLIDNIRPTEILIAGLGKNIIPMKGEIELQIELAGMILQHIFIVCDNIEDEFLAGTDIVNKTNMQINIPNREILTPYGAAQFLDKPVKLDGRSRVKCNRTITIPGNSAGYLVGRLGPPNKNRNYEGVVIGYDKLVVNSGICVQGSLAYSDRNLVPVQCINMMPHEVTIYKNDIVAFMEPLAKRESVRAVHRVKGQSNFYDATLDYPRLPTAESEEVTRENGKWKDPQELFRQLKVENIDISPAQKENLKGLLTEFSHVFARNKFDLGKASFFEANIDLKKDYVAKYVPTRSIPYKMRQHMREEVDNLINTGQIEPCKYSKFNSCIFLVSKPNCNGNSGGSFRLVQDLRALNSQTLPDNYPLPRIDTLLDKMTENNYLSVFDFLKGFVQIGLEEDSRQLTAFTYENERYQWARLPMGQTNSSSQFARAMSILWSKTPFEFLVSYLDDILVGSKTVDEHLKRLRFVFERLSWGNLKVSPHKCQLLKKDGVKFLGHRISSEGLQIDEDRIKAIQDLPEPKNVKQLQQCLGTMNYLRSYVYKFAEIAEPLYALLKKGVKYDWSDECKESFRILKTALTKKPIMAVPDVTDKLQSFEVTIDSSKKGHGAVLTQIVDGRRRVISYFSKGVPAHQKKLGASRLEFLGLYHALKHWRIYLESTNVSVLSDCMVLLRLETIFKNANSYFQRRLADLSGFRFTIKHVSGKSQQIMLADMLSRYPFEKSVKHAGCQTGDDRLAGEDIDLQNSRVPSGDIVNHEPQEEKYTVVRIKRALEVEDRKIKDPVTLDEIREEYANDRDLSVVVEWMKTGNVPEKLSYRKNTAQLCNYWQNINLLSFKNGILYRKWVDPSDGTKDCDLIVMPGTLIERILYMYHNNSGHSGVETALELCRRKFYFYKIKREFKMYCGACVVCARNKQSQGFLKAPLKPIVYTEFNQCISVDFNEPSKTKTKRGNVALLTIVDMYSNYLVCKPVKSTGSEEAIGIAINEWILKFGAPRNILHDLGSHFTSSLFKATMNVFDLRDTHGTPWHSQTQGRVEAFNKKVNVAMRVALNDEQWQDWDKYINLIVFTLNCLKSTKTGYSANYLAFGPECTMPSDLFIADNSRMDGLQFNETDQRKVLAYNKYREMCMVNRKVVANAATKAKYMKSYYDRNVRGPYPNKGDWCMLVVDVRKHKFADRFKGPYQIVEKINNWNYIVNIDGTRKIVSISKLKIYKPNKYSNLAVNGQPKAGHRVNLPTGANGGKRELHESSSSTDSDDEWSAIVTRSRAKKRAAKLNGKTKASTVDGKRRSDAGSRVNRGGNSGFLAGQDSISERQVRDMGSGGTSGHGSKLDLQDRIPNLDKSATEDVTDVDDSFVSADEGGDDQVASRPSATDTGETVEMTFPAINDQSLNIADIGRYETEQKVRDVPNYQNF